MVIAIFGNLLAVLQRLLLLLLLLGITALALLLTSLAQTRPYIS